MGWSRTAATPGRRPSTSARRSGGGLVLGMAGGGRRRVRRVGAGRAQRRRGGDRRHLRGRPVRAWRARSRRAWAGSQASAPTRLRAGSPGIRRGRALRDTPGFDLRHGGGDVRVRAMRIVRAADPGRRRRSGRGGAGRGCARRRPRRVRADLPQPRRYGARASDPARRPAGRARGPGAAGVLAAAPVARRFPGRVRVAELHLSDHGVDRSRSPSVCAAARDRAALRRSARSADRQRGRRDGARAGARGAADAVPSAAAAGREQADRVPAGRRRRDEPRLGGRDARRGRADAEAAGPRGAAAAGHADRGEGAARAATRDQPPKRWTACVRGWPARRTDIYIGRARAEHTSVTHWRARRGGAGAPR